MKTSSANNPRMLLSNAGISEKMLSDSAKHFLELFDKANALGIKHPASKDFRKNAERAGAIVMEVLEKELTALQTGLKNEVEENEKKVVKKAQSKKILDKSAVVLDDLANCREKLKEERKRKFESGEIKPRAKKTLVTKLRIELLKTVTLIPKNLKEDATVLERTQKVILTFLNELKSIWGLNKIKPIQDELEEKFKKLEEKAT
jgi:hypothetical protein